MSEPRRLQPGVPGWPVRLSNLWPSAPRELWIRGCRPLDELCASPSLAVVGARRCSAAGERFTEALAAGLARAGVAVISGLALGIDAAAHAGALAGGGRTIAVLGCGIDRLYPRRNAVLGRRVAEAGAVVAEWGPGVEPAPWRFPVRNRLIAALADATLVVEATRRSGALITADHALELGRDVLAVPGSAWQPLGEGVNALLREGAAPVTSLEDALDALGLPPQPPAASPAEALDGLERRVWEELRREPRRPDALALDLRAEPAALAGALAALELAGLLAREADGTVVAVASPGAAAC